MVVILNETNPKLGPGRGGCFWLQKSARRVEQWNRRAPSAPEVVRRGACAFSFLFPHTCEGAERRKTLRLSLHLAVPRALRARRLAALHCGVFHPGTVSSGPNRRLSSP